MEFNTNQQIIRTTQPYKIENAEHSIESELILPDSYGDIGRILKCKGEPMVLSSVVNGTNLRVEGTVVLHLLYVNTSGEICFYTQSLPFYHEGETEKETLIAHTTATMEYCNCRGVTTRKVEIRGAVNMKIHLEQVHDLTIITNAQGAGVQLERETALVSTCIATTHKTVTLTDEIQVESGSVYALLRCKGTVRDAGYKTINGKTVITGNLDVFALYRDPNGQYCPLQTQLPFSQVVDLEGIDPECICTTKFNVTALELRPRTGLDGECKTLLVNAAIGVEVCGYKTLSLPFVTDGFSTQCGLGLRKYTGTLKRHLETVTETHVCKKQMDIGREIGSVADLWCELSSPRVQCQQNKVTYTAIVTVCALVLDSDKAPLYVEKAVDTHWEYTLKEQAEELCCEPNVTITNVSYALVGDSTLDLRIHLEIQAPVFENLSIHPVVELTVDSSIEAPCCPAPLVVYFAKQGESVFQIARKYSTTVQAILEANNLTEPRVPGGALLVPACKE